MVVFERKSIGREEANVTYLIAVLVKQPFDV
jgi:hypothetical protein